MSALVGEWIRRWSGSQEAIRFRLGDRRFTDRPVFLNFGLIRVTHNRSVNHSLSRVFV
jgi:hypothetical protein